MSEKIKRWSGRAALLLAFVALAVLVVRQRMLPAEVETVKAKRGTVPELIHGPGSVQSRVPVSVSPRITGVIADLRADQGHVVRKGQLLALLDDGDLRAKAAAATEAMAAVQRNIAVAEASLERSRAELDLAASTLQRNRNLSTRGFISASGLDSSLSAMRAASGNAQASEAAVSARRAEARAARQEARVARAQLDFTRIVAPMDGVIVARTAEIGETLAPGMPIFRLVDPRQLWVAVRIDETVIGRIAPGQAARIRLRSGVESGGKVLRIAHESDAATREMEVNVAFDRIPERFAIGQEAEVSIMTGERAGILVPASAVTTRSGQQGILVVRDGRATFQPARVLANDSRHVALHADVQPDEHVLVAPAAVQPGSRVRPRPMVPA